jgi:phytoene/squalene synthetase
MDTTQHNTQSLATVITKKASVQTYYTIRLLVDRDLIPDAYRAYGYFRWVDDVLDEGTGTKAEKLAFVKRQRSLLDSCYQGEIPADLYPEEYILVDLVRNDMGETSGLKSYLTNMMAVMVFDAERRGDIISQGELSEYANALAVAVTDAMHYFIGHDSPAPITDNRYLAVTAAHVTHMLRDARDDLQVGYFNIPLEYLEQHNITQDDIDSPAYRRWVCSRVQLARNYFQSGREYLAQVKNLRCRLAGFAYTTRFEWMLRTIEKENFCLRSSYPERKSLGVTIWMVWNTLISMLPSFRMKPDSQDLAVQVVRINEP